MNKWLRHIRGTFGMGLTWAVGWGIIGGVIELVQNIVPGWNGAGVDIWPVALAMAGFFGGVTFSGALLVLGRRRSFEEMSLPVFAACGAAGGLAVSASLLLSVGVTPAALIAAAVVTLLCTGSASASFILSRLATPRELPKADQA